MSQYTFLYQGLKEQLLNSEDQRFGSAKDLKPATT